jgi:predicted RNA-binding Zn ribbon-like protein
MPVTASHLILLGGAVCLDFTNTRSRDGDEKPRDFLGNYLSLLQWALQLGLLTPSEAETQYSLANRQEAEAQAALERAICLREAVYTVFAASADGQEIPADALATISNTWIEAIRHRQLSRDAKKVVWEWVGIAHGLDRVLWLVVESAVDLLISEELPRVKRCNGCGWLFLDTTRDGRRRWCDMRICGNRAKARRHYEKRIRQPIETGTARRPGDRTGSQEC